jgi:hypothetical protein
MSYADLTACNAALERNRAACEGFAAWAKSETARLRAEAQELLHRADGIDEAAQVLRLKLNPTVR